MIVNNDEFIKGLLSLKDEPVAILGLANLMGIKLKTNEDEEKGAEDIISEMIIAFDGFNREKRKRILKIMKGTFRK